MLQGSRKWRGIGQSCHTPQKVTVVIMENQLFRDKSIQRVSSPEQLNDYIRVSNPGVWICMAAVLVLLAGVCVWGVFGQLDTTVSTAVVVKDGTMSCLVKEADIARIRSGMTVTAGGQECTIAAVSEGPAAVPEDEEPQPMILTARTDDNRIDVSILFFIRNLLK